VLLLAAVLLLVLSTVASGLVSRAAAFEGDGDYGEEGAIEMDAVEVTADAPGHEQDGGDGQSDGGGGGSTDAAVAQGNATRAQTAATKAAQLATMASALFGFGMAQANVKGHAAAAQQHAANALHAANLGDRPGTRAAMDAALAALEAAANELQSISMIGMKDGDPVAPAGYFESVDGFLTADNLENEAITAENAAAGSGSSNSDDSD